MTTLRRIIATIGITAALYAIATALFGALGFAHWLITITAIDHWHPNWPDPTTVDSVAKDLPTLTTTLAIVMLLIYIGTGFLHRWTTPPALSPGVMSATARPVAMAGLAWYPYKPTRTEFHAELSGLLRDAGLTPKRAVETADTAMLSADTDDPTDWAGTVRQEALNIAGIHTPYARVFSREPHLVETTLFLQNYGYRALLMKRIGSRIAPTDRRLGSLPTVAEANADYLNFDGILVFYRTSARAAEESLVELLIIAHQAHMASMDDNGAPRKAEAVEGYAKTLKHVSTKLALRGFVPPELDAEIGRDGTATAEELERWAIAQVVAACSPMTRMPLPTVERTTGGDQ